MKTLSSHLDTKKSRLELVLSLAWPTISRHIMILEFYKSREPLLQKAILFLVLTLCFSPLIYKLLPDPTHNPSSMALKLFGTPMSTCTGRVLACIHEKRIEFQLVPINLAAGEHKQPAFVAKNPFGVIPVLEDGDLTLFESRAITGYLSKKFKDQGEDLLRLKGGNLKEEAMVGVWLEVESQQYTPAITPIIFEHFMAPMRGRTPDQKVIDDGVIKFGKVLDVYEARLSQSKFLAGDFYSLADLHHLSYTHYFMKSPWASLINSRPHVKAWWEEISSRPASLKVTQAMTLGDKK